MSKDYRRRQLKQKSNAPKQLLVTLASFLCGYLTATIFDFTSLSTWVNKNLLNKHPGPQAQAMAEKSNLPKPKFEFYTLLSKDNSAPIPVNRGIPQTAPITHSAPAAPPPPALAEKALQTVKVAESLPVTTPKPSTSKETYLIQIAAFNKRKDAEHLKATLVLRGFDVTISEIDKQNITWFRVTIGPFYSRNDAEKAQATVARNERMKGMIRKMNS